ncbi:MAG: hypothetical protein EZS28_045207, partial [Streblomastix strix]
LEAKINHVSLNRQRDYQATKSYLLKYIDKPGAGYHHSGYGEGQIEVQELILRQARGETVSIANWIKSKAKKEIKVLPFGIIQDRDTGRMIDQIEKEIIRIFRLEIIEEIISGHKVVGNQQEEENSYEGKMRFIIIGQRRGPEVWNFVDQATVVQHKLFVIQAGVNIARLFRG